MMRTLVCVTTLGLVAISAPASAQDAQPAPAPATAAPAASAEAGAATPTAPPSEEEQFHARFRWGISGYGGPIISGGSSSGGGGLDLRFGATITPLIGVYGQPVLLLGGSAGATGGSAVAFGGVGGHIEITPLDMIYVGLGPEILAGGQLSASTTAGTAAASSGSYFSFSARAGLALGSYKPSRRKAFTIGLDFRSIFTPGSATVVPGIALGYDSF